MKASNFHLHIHGNSHAQLNAALEVAMDGEKARAWRVENGWFILYWNADLEGVEKFPFEEDVGSVQHTVWQWLAAQPKDRANEPDIDGSCHWEGWELRSGWTATSEVATSPQEHRHYEILRIRPRWAEYHK